MGHYFLDNFNAWAALHRYSFFYYILIIFWVIFN